MDIKKDKKPITLIVIIVVLAFISGYFIGILSSAGNFTLNVTNKTNDTGTDYKDYNYKNSYKPTDANRTPIHPQNDTPGPKPDPKPDPNSTIKY